MLISSFDENLDNSLIQTEAIEGFEGHDALGDVVKEVREERYNRLVGEYFSIYRMSILWNAKSEIDEHIEFHYFLEIRNGYNMFFTPRAVLRASRLLRDRCLHVSRSHAEPSRVSRRTTKEQFSRASE